MSASAAMDIAIVGDARTGKSTLIQFLAQLPVKVENKMAVYCPSSVYGEDQVSLTLTTTHGTLTVNCFVSMQSPLDRHFDAAIVLFDSNNANTVTNLTSWIDTINKANSDAPIVIADTTASTAEQTDSKNPPAELSPAEHLTCNYDFYDFHLIATELQDTSEKNFHQTPQIEAICQLAKSHLHCDQLELNQTVPIDVVIVLPNSSVKCNRIRKQQKCYFYPRNVVGVGQASTNTIKTENTGITKWFSNWWK